MLVAECSFYNVAGSKAISTAEGYVEMHRAAKERGVSFLWITDGPAWLNMKEPLIRTMKEMDWVLNFRMLSLIKSVV